MKTHPAVDEAAVIGQPDGHSGESVAAFVVTNFEISKAELIEYSRDFLSPYKVPQRVYFRQALARNFLGKVIKHRLE